MKYIVKFKQVNPECNITLDAYSDEVKYQDFSEYLDMVLPYTKIFENIFLKNFKSLSANLLSKLTHQYLHGANIILVNKKLKLEQPYKLSKPNKFYAYSWVPLDLTAPISRQLAEFKFVYKGKRTTYLNAIKTLNSTRFLPNEIWNALDVYSRERIDKCRQLNKGNYELAEEWFKQLTKDGLVYGFKVFSPNKKTYYEAMAEINFEKSFEVLPDGCRPLTEEELNFLKVNAPKYGIEIQAFTWRINTRKTDHGYTAEPERIYTMLSDGDYNRAYYDPRNNNNLPKNQRAGLTIKSYENQKLLREAYFELLWIMKNLGNAGLDTNYHRCPKCHKVYNEYEGCECGYCLPIEQVRAENLLYGISGTYEDYEDTKSAYDDLENEYDTDNCDDLVD